MKKGHDCLALEHAMWKLLDARGAEYPAEHNVGHLYHAKPDLAGFYRDVLARQLGVTEGLRCEDVRDAVERVAVESRPEQTLRRIEAVLACRDALDRNVAPLLAVEAMTVALRAG